MFHDGYEPDVMTSKQKIDRNLKLLQTMIEEEADNPAWWFYLGRELLGTGKDTEAVEALIEAERRAIPYPLFGRMLDIYKYLMDIYYQRKDWEQTAVYCMKALDYQSDFPDAHYMLAQVRIKQADQLYRDAETGFKKAKESFHSFRSIVSPNHEIGEWKVDVALGDIAHRAGKSSVARKFYSNVLRQNPHLVNVVGQRLATIESERLRLNDHIK